MQTLKKRILCELKQYQKDISSDRNGTGTHKDLVPKRKLTYLAKK